MWLLASCACMAAFAFGVQASAFLPDNQDRVYRPSQISDLDAIASRLKRHVAYIKSSKTQADPKTTFRDGYGVVLSGRQIACLAFVVEGHTRVEVTGPNGQSTLASVVLYNAERRVAILKSHHPLSRLGFETPASVTKSERRQGMDVFALVSIAAGSGVVHGVLTHLGDAPEYEGHPRIDLKLRLGMPVFDNRARFVGYARHVAWDQDPFMLITPEMISGVQTATAAASGQQREPRRPWWAQ